MLQMAIPALVAGLVSSTADGLLASSQAQQDCRQLGLWTRYLIRSGLSAEQSCSHLGLHESRYCSAAGFDEATCIVDSDYGRDGRARAERHRRAIAVAEQQNRASLWNGTCAFTISSWNNVGVVVVFLRSILAHNSLLACVAWVVADIPNPPMQNPLFEAIHSRLGALRDEWPAVTVHLVTLKDLNRSMAYSPLELAFRYPRKEFNTAIKPHAFNHFFASGAKRVLFFDPDIEFYASLDEIALLLHWRSFVITPHETRDTPDDGQVLTDLQIRQAGIFNYGFVAMSDAHPQCLHHHLKWWSDKLRCNQITKGMHYDQAWADFIPSFYPRGAYEILIDPRYNIASWNLHYRGRHITYDATTGTARYGSLPLVFYHFSGTSTSSVLERERFSFSSISPYQTRYALHDFPQLEPIFENYRHRLAAENFSVFFNLPYGFDYFANGVPIAQWMRRTYAMMCPDTQLAFRNSMRSASSVSLASHLVSANPFSGGHNGTIWDWLFTPAKVFYGALTSAPKCSGRLSVNIVVHLSQMLRMDRATVQASDCSQVRAFLPLILSYLTEDAMSRLVRKDILRVLVERSSVHADGAKGTLCSEGTASDLQYSFLCAAIRQGRQRMHELWPVDGHSGNRLPHHMVSKAFWRTSAQLQRLRATIHGVSVMGYFDHALGIADAARLTYRALDAHRPFVNPTAVPVMLSLPAFPELTKGMNTSSFTVHRTTIVVVNADQSRHIERMGVDAPGYAKDRYWIAVWYWELEQFPPVWRDDSFAFDEIWVSSGFIADSIRKELDTSNLTQCVKVFVMPLGLPVPTLRGGRHRSDEGSGRLFLNIPHSAFVFLTIFDFNSYYERKRPDLVVAAFKLAFGSGTQSERRPIHLIIKSMNGAQHAKERQWLREAASGWANMHLLDRHLLKAEMDEMRARADCVVSLHSSEGYGLNILMPLLQGVPVISTLYSGNMEFMQHLPSKYLELLGVGYTLERIQYDVGPYLAGNIWARPNVSQAAAAMRRTAASELGIEIWSLAMEAAKTLAAKFNLRTTGKSMVNRLREIDTLLDARASVPMRSAAADKELCCWIKGLDQGTDSTCTCSGLSRTIIEQAAKILNETGHMQLSKEPSEDDIYCYWLRYEDLQRVLTSFDEVKTHHMKTGRKEGRSTSCTGIDPKEIAGLRAQEEAAAKSKRKHGRSVAKEIAGLRAQEEAPAKSKRKHGRYVEEVPKVGRNVSHGRTAQNNFMADTSDVEKHHVLQGHPDTAVTRRNVLRTAFVTGLTGQDGSYLAELLLNYGYTVHGLVRRSSMFNTQRIGGIASRLHLHYGDLTDSTNLLRIIQRIQPDEVYNLAAQSHVMVSFEMSEYTGEVDGIGVLKLLNAIVSAGLERKTRFYQASTSELYGRVHETPQSEETPFHPRSPYGVAKLYGFWITKHYREAYGIHASNGILFNHESPRRGPTFLTRKVTRAVARIHKGMQSELVLGNLNSQRDWGHARDYVEAMYLMVQMPQPDDYVVATGKTTTVRTFVEAAFGSVRITLVWTGTGVHEVGHEKDKPSRVLVRVNESYFRPSEVDLLLGNPRKAKERLGWEPKTSIEQLCKEMVQADIKLLENGDTES